MYVKFYSFPRMLLWIALVLYFFLFFINRKVKSCGENTVFFLTKYCGLLQYFSKQFFSLFYWEKHYSFPHKTLSIAATFFLIGFFPSKIIFVGFFLILSFFFCFLLTEKLNHVAKTLYLSSQNTVDCYKSFCSVSKFLITNTTFNFYYLSSAGSQL